MATDYYSEMKAEGEAFERYVLKRLLSEWRIGIERCDNKADQIAYGDTFFGLEIKFDREFRKTGNLCIEVAEKTNAANAQYIASGIYAESSAWLYGIGNAEEFFIFSKRTLRRVHDQIEHGLIKFKFTDRSTPFYKTQTSKGFLIPRREIVEFCEVAFYWGTPV